MLIRRIIVWYILTIKKDSMYNVNAYIFNHSFFQIKRPYRRIVTSVSRWITWSTYSTVISYIEQITVVLWQSAIQSKCRLLPIRLSKRDFKALNSHHCVKCHIPITQLFSLRIQYSRTFDVYIDHSMIKKSPIVFHI